MGGGFGFDACPPPVREGDEDAELVEDAAVPPAVDPLAAEVCVCAFAGVVL